MVSLPEGYETVLGISKENHRAYIHVVWMSCIQNSIRFAESMYNFIALDHPWSDVNNWLRCAYEQAA